MKAQISFLLHCAENQSHMSQVSSFLADRYALSEDELLKSPDLHWLNPDSDPEEFKAISIEQVRDMMAELVMRPFQGIGELKQAVFVICKIDLASVPAQNALLKSLEEPPAHVQFVLTTNQPQRVLPTIASRCELVESPAVSAAEKDRTQETKGLIDLEKMRKSTYTDLIEQANQYKEKPEALSFLKELLNTLHRDNILQPDAQKTKLMQETVVALDYLGKNVNTRLVLENLLFQFKTV